MTLVGAITGEPVDDVCLLCGLPFTNEGEIVARLMDLDGHEWCVHMRCFDAAEEVDTSILNASDQARLEQVRVKASERAATLRKKLN